MSTVQALLTTTTTAEKNREIKSLNMKHLSKNNGYNNHQANYITNTDIKNSNNSTIAKDNIYFDNNENMIYKKFNEQTNNNYLKNTTNRLNSKETTLLEQPHDDEMHTIGKPSLMRRQITNQPDSFIKKLFNFKTELIWLNIVSIIGFHIFAMYILSYYNFFNYPKSFFTVAWAIVTGGIAGFGVTAGAHRLWSHRSYKAKLPLRIILMLCYAMAGQNRLYDWVRDHRVHHKFSETDADPHNANRGFFFAHVGWLMMRKHPDVLKKGKQIDMSDILEDPVIQFFERYFYPIKFIFCFIIPSIIPIYGWNETWFYAVCSQCVIRYVMSLNFTWLVNSAAHIWGNKPYDRRIGPVENMSVAIVAMGEGWHNYHHVFPWDYKAAELGTYSVNITTFWLDLFAKIGWAYDLKTPSKELVQKVIEKSGDGTHPIYGEHEISENEDKWQKQN